jgi:outer membrane immunogenic protein
MVAVLARETPAACSRLNVWNRAIRGFDMRTIISTGIGLLVIAGAMQPVAAADIAVKAPVYKAAPPIIPVFSWTGFYAGLNIGYGWGRSRTDENFSDNGTGALLATINNSSNMNGVIGGGQVGYNWQFGNWVAGFETDFQGSGQKSNRTIVCPAATCTNAGGDVTGNLDEKLPWFGTVRGRFGATVTPTVLAYVTGGLAYGEVKNNLTVSGTNGMTPVSTMFSNSTTKAGWTVGGGVESQIVGNWTAKLEYLYMDLGTVTTGMFTTPITAPSGGALSTNTSSRVTDNIVRFGVNYKFGQGVGARY